jgi:hypothetical protein
MLNRIMDFETGVLFLGAPRVFKAHFKRHAPKDPSKFPDTYDEVQDEFQSAFDKTGGTIVAYTLNLAGIPGKFYPHTFHVALEKEAPYAFVAGWGADPETPYFTIVIEDTH